MVKKASRFNSITKQNLLAAPTTENLPEKKNIMVVKGRIKKAPEDRPTQRLQVMLTNKEALSVAAMAGDVPISRFLRKKLKEFGLI